MELALKKESIGYCGCVFEKNVKQSLDLAWTLPDYCSDIQRILQCTVTPCVSGVSVNGSILRALGEVQVRLVYVNEKGSIDCFFETSQLSASTQWDAAQDDAVVLAFASVDYLNPRASGPRRFTLTGAVGVLFRAFARKTQPILCALENCGGQMKNEDIACLSLVGCSEKTFELSETLELPERARNIDKLLRTSGKLRLDSKKAVSGKLLLRGELIVSLLYLGGDDAQTLHRYEHRMPINQILEAQGVTEDTLCEITLHLQCLRVTARADSEGRQRLVDIQSMICAFVKAFETRTQTVTTDCYATEAPLRVSRQQVQFCRHLESMETAVDLQTTLDPGEKPLKSVEDAAVQKAQCFLQNSEDGWELVCEAAVDLICRTPDGEVFVVQQSASAAQPLTLSQDADSVTGVLTACAQQAQASVHEDGSVSMRVRIDVQGELYALSERTICVDAALDDSAPAAKRSALTLYFPQPGESLWEIAKQYRTSVGAIRRENHLEGDVITQAQMLLVPMR